MDKKPGRSNPVVLVVVLLGGTFALVALLCLASALFGDGDNATPRPTSAPAATQDTTRYILYKVEGNGRTASVTYENGDGNSEQQDIEIPWRKGFTFTAGDFVYLSVQSTDNGSRSITCEIVQEGEVIETATSQGEYVIASCSGRVGE